MAPLPHLAGVAARCMRMTRFAAGGCWQQFPADNATSHRFVVGQDSDDHPDASAAPAERLMPPPGCWFCSLHLAPPDDSANPSDSA